MLLNPLAKEQEIEFIVSEIGNAMLLHRGPLKHRYSWVEYDRAGASLNFITPEGEIQPLGFKIHKPFEAPLCKTLELLMVEVGDDNQCKDLSFIKFAKMVE